MARSLSPGRLLLWLFLTAPAAWILWQYLTEAISYGQVIHYTGDFAVQLLIVTLAATPLRLAFPGGAIPRALIAWRRNMGVACLGYALVHLGVYLIRKAELSRVLSEGREIGLLTGWIALALLLPLALTSNDASVRVLGRAWKALHRLVYPAAVLALAHWLLTAFDMTMGLIHAGVLVAIEAARILLTLRGRRA